MIIGLDLSTTVCGWCILSDDGKLGAIGYHKFIGKDLYERLNEFKIFVLPLLPVTQNLFIEEPLKRMSRRRSTAHVLCLLQRWNGMVSALLHQHLHIKPQLLDAQQARRQLSLILPRKVKRKECKDIVLRFVQAHCDAKALRELKKTGRPKDYCYDMADAYVIAKAAYVKQSGNSDSSAGRISNNRR